MATIGQITADVNSAKVYAIQQSGINLILQKNGQCAPGIKNITALKRIIRCLTFQINANVVDTDTNTLYNCLLKTLAGFNSNYTIDPSVIIPGTTIIISGGGSKVNSAIIPFNNQTVILLAGYQATYYPTYGNTPYVQIFVADGVGGFAQDNGTAPDYTYVTPGNPASGITSITWAYGVVTSGYVLISGVQPTT